MGVDVVNEPYCDKCIFLPFYNIKVRIFLTLRESNGRKYFPAFTHRVMACAGAVANVLLYRTTIK